MSGLCGAFPDPMQVPARFLGPQLPTCERDSGHEPPHRAVVTDGHPLPVRLEWEDPEHFAAVMRSLEQEFGRDAIRMWVERAPEHGDLGMPPTVVPWLTVPDWGRPAQPVAVEGLEEFQRAYGPSKTYVLEKTFKAREPSITVDRYGGTYSMTRVPVPTGWRKWAWRARRGWYAARDTMGEVAATYDDWLWRGEDVVWRAWRKVTRRS